MPSAVTPERFASGMTYEEYAAFVGSPQNLKRESSGGGVRRDYSAYFREAYARTRLTEAQAQALKWLGSQPGGPAKMLVLSEDWSSDCRRDLPAFARIAEAAGMELRIFPRDGAKFSDSNHPSLAEAPDSNADIMAEFLLHKDGNTWQSIPIAVFYTKDMQYLYHYQEYPRIYDKDRLVVEHIRGARAGETREQTRERSEREFGELFNGPFFAVWTSAAVDEIISALHRKVVLGTV
jgi:hypothetical protein